ncbi:hypothetical protein INT45_002896 [Circinella minor]|uniref:Required for respiratory growth protein 8, mitochondrial n=1 Tax=Circinella minor TaxID=1195481 RepID=A0A8H7VHR5_9FUNG|nr:hypothetical protein INT45_002896 [Circinella minor]
MISPKNIKIGQRIDKLAQKLKSAPLQKAKRPSISQKKQNAIPKTLQEKVMASPYATILASPLRLCGYQRRMFPSKMLLRFGLMRNPKKDEILPVSEVTNTKPNGPNDHKHYVRLRRPILDDLSQKGSKAIFLGKTEFQKDTMNIVRRESVNNVQKKYNTLLLSSSQYKQLIRLENDLWKPLSSNDIDEHYHCILISSSDENVPFYQSHRIENRQGVIPCYNISRLWKDSIEKDIAYGLVQLPINVELAVALYRCRELF